MHADGNFGGGGCKISDGLHGLGVSFVNFLSSCVTVTFYKDGKIHEAKFENSRKIVEHLTVIWECEENRTGTTVNIKPDREIFDTDIYDYKHLKR